MQRRDIAAVFGLLLLLGGFLARSWLAWGDFDLDYGREMYVPLRLVEGDVLYRDVRYPYGPLSPYLHALGYWLWKPHLGVLYASGIFATTTAVLVLYAIARRLTTIGVAFLATVLATVDLMFIPGTTGTFSYVFPYAYPTLHGLVFLLVAVMGALLLLTGGGRMSAATTGIAIGLAVLTKPEFGLAGLGLAGLVAILLPLMSPQRARAALPTLAASAVGVAACGYGLLSVYVSPKTVLMRGLFAPEYFVYGGPIFDLIAGFLPNSTWQERVWTLVRTWRASAAAYGALAAIAIAAGLAFAAVRAGVRAPRLSSVAAARVVGVLVAVAALMWLAPAPQAGVPMVLRYAARASLVPRYGLLPIALFAVILVESTWLVRQWRRPPSTIATHTCRLTVAVVALALLVRTPANLNPVGYCNFYLPLGVILCVHLVVDLLPRALSQLGVAYEASRAAVITVVAVEVLALGIGRYQLWGWRDTPVHTRRGTLVVASRQLADTAYPNVLEWLEREAPPDATLVAIPRGTSLSFLSGHGNRLYEVGLVGVIPDAAAERAYVQALERELPTLIVTSDQAQHEYGRGNWGTQDNLEIARWVRARYTSVHVTQQGRMNLTIWRRQGQTVAAPGAEAAPAGR